ncbi:MAG: LCP family protein, partial [Chloroflexota bacterium]|nr:LCP family protein [Chloroflexota bacterium]
IMNDDVTRKFPPRNRVAASLSPLAEKDLQVLPALPVSNTETIVQVPEHVSELDVIDEDDEPTLKLPRRLYAKITRPLPRITGKLPELEGVGEHAPVVTDLSAITSEPEPGPPITKKRKRRFPIWARILSAILLLLLVLGGVGYYYFDVTVQKPLTKIIHQVPRSSSEQKNVIPSDSNVTGKVWNILLLGSDNDNKYTFPAVLTQVMMVVHIDTIHNAVTMLSIPRDSWVSVPEIGGMHKIDQAFYDAVSQHHNFDDGVRVARLTIEKDYGITIDRYAWVGLSGFASVIDTLGGVDINLTHPIVDDQYPNDTGAQANSNDPYAYKRLYITPGPQHLTGLQALEYVRSRHADLVGDIGRTQRQQQVLQALKLKLNATSVLAHLSALIADLNGKVYTDLTEEEMLGFAGYAHGLAGEAIDPITLGPGTGSQDYGDFGKVYDPAIGAEQDIVVPHCENIQPLINKIFGLGNVQSCRIGG